MADKQTSDNPRNDGARTTRSSNDAETTRPISQADGADGIEEQGDEREGDEGVDDTLNYGEMRTMPDNKTNEGQRQQNIPGEQRPSQSQDRPSKSGSGGSIREDDVQKPRPGSPGSAGESRQGMGNKHGDVGN